MCICVCIYIYIYIRLSKDICAHDEGAPENAYDNLSLPHVLQLSLILLLLL